ncbi:MAG: glycosyltransferase family 2 protein [Candidatus Omnitrophica bacterium]|nr:glycosyltransferase family 2 protein [Candidatus Omnitrophota bacterium]
MSTVFYFSLLALFYTYFGYLGISIILGKLFFKKIDKKVISPSVTLLIPAYNEQSVIAQKLENSLSLDYPQELLEIVVASESNDGTNDIVRKFEDKGVLLYSFKERRGKSRMLYDVYPKAKGEIVLFSDANAIYDSKAIRKLVRNFNDKRVGGVLGNLIITNPDKSSISEGESVFKRYESLLRISNTNQLAIVGADGSMLAIRKELYFPISPDRGDDFELAIRIRVKGYSMVFEPEAISYEKASTDFLAEISRKRRIVSWFFKSSFILLGEMLLKGRWFLLFQVISNKLFRWFSPYFLILLFVSSVKLSTEHIFYQIVFYSQILFYVLAMFSGIFIKKADNKLQKILRMPFFFVVFNYAFFIGTLEGMFMRQKPFWKKVR